MKPNDKKETLMGIFWEIFSKYGSDSDSALYVHLTEEVAAHMMEMYYSTDWEKVTDVLLPEDWCEEITVDIMKKHIGEWITVYGFEEEDEFMSSSHFCNGSGFRYLDECLNGAVLGAFELYGGNLELGMNFLSEVGQYYSLAVKNGKTPAQIVSDFSKEIKKF